MFDIRPVFMVVGWLLVALAGAMLAPAVVELETDGRQWHAFLLSAAVTLFIGGLLVSACRTEGAMGGLRQAFLMAVLSWVALGAFAALPFLMADMGIGFTDAVFEAISGITTTGSTVLTGLDGMPKGILLWRALLQWLGGVGIVVTAIALFPLLQVGGMQLFRIESGDRSEKVLPRAGQIAGFIGVLYVTLTLVLAIALAAAGLPPFDAIAHAMTTIATGGFSTRDASIGHYSSAAVDWIVTVGMVAGSLPFVLYIQALRGRPGRLWRDTQVRAFLGILGAAVLLLTASHLAVSAGDPFEVLSRVAFNATSIMTGTGFSTDDFGSWGRFAPATFFCLMFIGGCAGSTTCGLKVFRLQVMFAEARAQLARLARPHGVFRPYYGGKPVPEGVAASVTSFVFVYLAAFAALAIALSLIGLDFETAISGAATAISNVGPGLGDTIGPAGTFAPLDDAAKWVLIVGMLLGRLEVLTVLLLFTPSFWRA